MPPGLLKTILIPHKTKWHQTKFTKVYMYATISILCMFIRVDDVTNVIRNFVTL